MVNFKDYDIYKVRKKNKIRTIYSPRPKLKRIQKQVLSILTRNYYNLIPDCVHGFMLGKSIYSAVYPHMKNKYIMKFDFKDFFPSHTKKIITDKLITNINIKYNVANYIANLCCYNNEMVLGSVISPFITNLCMLEFDKQFNQWCQENNITYTRYADDIILSNNEFKFDRYQMYNIIYSILRLSNINYLKINYKKTKFGKRNLLGVNIHDNELSIPFKTRNHLRAILFTYGLTGIEFSDFDDSIKGYLSFIRYINKRQYEKLIKNYNKGLSFYLQKLEENNEKN